MDLDQLRTSISDIDRRLLDLLRQRAEVAHSIGEVKRANGQAILDSSREQSVLEALTAGDTGLLSREAIRTVFAEIISACRAVQEPLSVAYFGPAYTFTHLGARRRFGSQAEYMDFGSIHEVFDAVEKRAARVGVVPVENSLGGAVPETLDCLVTSDLNIIGDHYEPIHHCLLALDPDAPITRLYSHPQPLAQCRRWIREKLAGIEIVSAASTAAAAQAAAADPGVGALSPAEAAEGYGLQIVARNVEDYPNNRTRFVVLGHGICEPSGRDRTSLVFTTQHRAGALHEALTPLRVYGVNMALIQSRPVPGRLWEYVFFVDIEGHVKDPVVATAIEDIKRLVPNFRVLGSYPAAE